MEGDGVVGEGIKRVLVEKRAGFDVEAKKLFNELVTFLGISNLKSVRVINAYDIEGISDKHYQDARTTIFSEPQVDNVYDEVIDIPEGAKVLAIEMLPGQYDQRADSAAQCLQILTQGERPTVKTLKIILLEGSISDSEFAKIKGYCINPVECREASMDKPEVLEDKAEMPPDVLSVRGFAAMTPENLDAFRVSMGLAMSLDDLLFC